MIPGRVVRFEDRPDLKIPHMGWNRIERNGDPWFLQGTPDQEWFYFVHSYHVVPDDESVIAARTNHGVEFVSMIARDNLVATQFHPEKSQSAGMVLLENFARRSRDQRA